MVTEISGVRPSAPEGDTSDIRFFMTVVAHRLQHPQISSLWDV